MSTLATAPESAGPDDPATPTAPPAGSRAGPTDPILALCLTGALLAVAFLTSSGVDQSTPTAGTTWTEIALTLLGALAIAAAALGAGLRRARAWGAGTVGLMAVLTAFTGLSIIWSVVPDTSWLTANQSLAYLAAFAGAAALARIAPGRWPVMVGAIALLCVALSGWAVLAKVFPATLAPDNTVGRLQAPFGYWNAVGICGALGIVPCLWAGSRRATGRQLAALAAPGTALGLSAVMLSSSRSADAAAIIAIGCWLGFVPLRLRSAAVLGLGAIGAAVISGWALAHGALTADGPPAAAMDSAGHTFGLIVAAVLVLTTVAGLALARAMDRRTVGEATRRRLGTALVVAACLLPVAAIGALATSSRGLTGEISHAWTTLTSTHAVVGNNPGRVLEFGSSRPLYWHQGLDVGSHALLKGAGASAYGTARLRYTTAPWKSDQAHSYIIETFADLGLIGIALILALLISWCVAAARPVAVRAGWRALSGPESAERAGLIALALVVLAFGIESALDWTWYFPGVSVPVLLCAGWLAGRGPLRSPVGWQRPKGPLLDRPGAVAAAATVLVLAVVGAWLQWQPRRSAEQVTASLTAAGNAEAFADARNAAGSDPLSLEPHYVLGQLYKGVGDIPAARAQLVRATQIQPDNPQPWAQLAAFELAAGRPRAAIAAAQRTGALDHTADPTTATAISVINQARAQMANPRATQARKRK